MLFDLTNYIFFIIFLAAIYMGAITYIQGNVGGKGRFKAIQVEMRENQKKMMEASRAKRDKEAEELMGQYWKLTSEMMKLQFMFLIPILVIFAGLAFFFPMVEPGMQDDVRLPLFDDGLAAHCDASGGDGIFSNCYAIPQGAQKGAWVIDAYLYSAENESLARNSTAIYIEGGKPSDVWLQSHSQNGFTDGLTGKGPHTLSGSSDRGNYSIGETVSISASYSPQSPSAGPRAQERVEAVLDSGTFFYLDLPFALPLINISRIIGSYGVFIFLAFVLSMCYSIAKAIYDAATKKKQVN